MPNWPTEPTAGHVWLYMFYTIWFKDTAAYETAVGTFGDSVSRCPGYMRTALGIADTANGWDTVDDTWIQFNQPPYVIRYNIDGSWQAPQPIKSMHTYVYPSSPGDPEGCYWWPPSTYTFDYNQDWLDIPGHPAVPIWGAGPPLAWVWVGILNIAGAKAPSTPTPDAYIRQRRWITGFETQCGGQSAPSLSPELEGGTTASECYSRAASRTPDGIGVMLGNNSFRHFLNEQIPVVLNARNSWERFYIKIQKLPTTEQVFWSALDDGGGSAQITIDSTGKLNGKTIDNFVISHTNLDPAGSVLPTNRWLRCDVYINYTSRSNPSGGCDANVTMWILGTQVVNYIGSIDVGFGPHQRLHTQTSIGGGTNYEILFDDWSNMNPGDPDLSGDDGAAFATTIDYGFGHHQQLIRNISLAESTNWAGDYRRSMQIQPANSATLLVSSTSGARLSLNTEMDGSTFDSAISFIRQFGSLAVMAVTAISKGVQSTTDKIGSILGAAPSEASVTQNPTSTALNGYAAMRNVAYDSLLDEPPALALVEPALPLHIKSTDANVTNDVVLMLEAQFMGAYGPEDEYEPTDFRGMTDLIGFHNAPYYNNYMGRATVPPPNSVGIASGTYVGNGTGQDLTIVLPGVHFLYIRNTTTNVQTWWWTTMLGPHAGTIEDDIFPPNAVQVLINTDGDTVIRITGALANSNTNLVTYQYVAFSDVMSRILLNHCWIHETTGPFTEPLFDTAYLPEFSVIMQETVKNNSSTSGMYLKGPGFGVAESKRVDNSLVTANSQTFGAGSVIESLNNGIGQTAAMFWRQTDGNSINPNIIYIGQYTGNGAGGTRNITVTLNGRRPLFAMVIAATTGTGGAICRDPGNLTNTSNRLLDGLSQTTGITGGGVDMIQVGTALNANLVVYSVLILPSCTTDAGNGGWGVDGVCGLAESGWNGPGAPTAPSWMLTPPDIPADIALVGQGGLVLSGEASRLMVLSMSGIYTLIPGKANDTIYDRQVGQTELDVKIPDPFGKTGYIGG